MNFISPINKNFLRFKTLKILSITILIIALFKSTLTAQETLVFSTIREAATTKIVQQVLKEAYGQLNKKVEVINLPGKRALNMSNNGDTDGELCRIINIDQNFKNLIMVPVPVITLQGVAATRNAEFSNWSADQLKPYTIGIVRGIIITRQLTKGMNIIVFNDYEELLKVMQIERVDVALGTRLDLVERINKLNIEGVKIIEPPIMEIKLYHYLNKKHEILVPKITQILEEMNKKNRIFQIKQDYMTSGQKN